MTKTRDLRGDDTIDSRDVIERISTLESEVEDMFTSWWEDYRKDSELPEDTDQELFRERFMEEHRDEDELEELAALKGLKSKASDASDWKYGATLIRDSYFTEYAQKFAENLGYVKHGVNWPYTCIDWERAADELKADYSAVEFNGVTYWVRD